MPAHILYIANSGPHNLFQRDINLHVKSSFPKGPHWPFTFKFAIQTPDYLIIRIIQCTNLPCIQIWSLVQEKANHVRCIEVIAIDLHLIFFMLWGNLPTSLLRIVGLWGFSSQQQSCQEHGTFGFIESEERQHPMPTMMEFWDKVFRKRTRSPINCIQTLNHCIFRVFYFWK